MEFLLVGLNHRTSPLEVREQLSLTKTQWPEALETMAGYGVPGVILCTCNRSEFYVVEASDGTGPLQQFGAGEERIKQFLVDRFKISLLDIDRFLYVYRGQECVQHLFRVASSLDSMILGEDQIIGQVRESFDAASLLDTVPGPLSHLFQRALRVGRKVRRETGIGRNALSVSRACVDLAKHALGDLKGRQAMVIGAGDAGELTARALARAGVKNITVTNRTYQRAEELARGLSAEAIPFQDFPRALEAADIAIGCTGAPEYVLGEQVVRQAMSARKERPLFLLDIAVPRDIDPAVGGIENVYLHDVDDVESVSEASRQEKEQEASWAEELVVRETTRFLEWYRNQEIMPSVIALRNKAEQIRERELSKTLKRLNGRLTSEDISSLDAMTRAIINKLLHDPTVYLKGHPDASNLSVAKEIFRLSQEQNEEEPNS